MYCKCSFRRQIELFADVELGPERVYEIGFVEYACSLTTQMLDINENHLQLELLKIYGQHVDHW